MLLKKDAQGQATSDRMASSPGSTSINSRPVAILEWSIALSLVVPVVLFIIVASSTRLEALGAARSRLDRTAKVAEEHAIRVMETNFVIAREIRRTLELGGRRGSPVDALALHERLRELGADLEQIQSIWVWNAQGRPLASNRFYPPPPALNVSDRDYFSWARTGGGQWFVSAPLVSRTTGEPFIDVTGRWLLPDGRFGGAISVSLYPKHFTEFYRGLAEHEPGLAVSLLRSDGVVIARWPDPPSIGARLAADSPLLAQMKTGAKSGRTSGRSSLDGIEREVSFRKVGPNDVYVAATANRDRIFAPWYRDMALLAAIMLPAAFIMAFLSYLALKRTRHQQATLARLSEESEQRVKAEDSLRHAQKLEAVGRLTGGVAHDFNNLLMIINTNAYLLKRRLPEAADSPQLSSITRAVESGSRLTRQLLAFSRRQALHPRVVSLQDELPTMADLLRATTGSAITVSISVDSTTRPICVDPAEFELALINLAINARDAMPNGGSLTVTAFNAVSGGDVAVSVHDTGSGISPDIIDKVFEPFYTTKPPGHGTGLGLSQVHGFCAQASGRVEIESKPGAGTRVTMYLPSVAAGKPRAPTPPPAAKVRLAGNVLLVEDNPDISLATAAILADLGFSVRSVDSGDAALAMLSANNDFDAVVTDVMMPGEVDGMALTAWVRDHRPDIAVLIITGYTTQIELARRYGFPVLPKPCSPETIASALTDALSQTGRMPRDTS